MSRRSSACAFACALALSNIANAAPIQANDVCVDDGPVQALQAAEPAADLFCKDYAPWGPPTATATVVSQTPPQQIIRAIADHGPLRRQPQP